MAFEVYILKSRKDKGFYIGQSQDAAKRLKDHNMGKKALKYCTSGLF